MRAALAAAALLAFGTGALAQQPPPQAAPAEGWDGRLPQGQLQQQQPAPQAGYGQGDGYGNAPPLGYANPPPLGYANGYGVPVLILPPLRYGVPLCPDRAPPYFAGGFKPRGPYTAWHGSALPPAPGYGQGYGQGYGGPAYGDPYALDPRNCAPARSWNGDEGRARSYYIPPSGRR